MLPNPRNALEIQLKKELDYFANDFELQKLCQSACGTWQLSKTIDGLDENDDGGFQVQKNRHGEMLVPLSCPQYQKRIVPLTMGNNDRFV